MTESWFAGVGLSDRLLNENEGAFGDAVLTIVLPESVTAEYEWEETH
jgi:hypothetical protein